MDCKDKGEGGSTLVQDAVEFKLLDPFGGCLGCHRELFLRSLSFLPPFYFVGLDYVIFRPLIKGAKSENWFLETIEIAPPST